MGIPSDQTKRLLQILVFLEDLLLFWLSNLCEITRVFNVCQQVFMTSTHIIGVIYQM